MNGPLNKTIPEQKYLSCSYCTHYSHQMMKSGFNPIFAHICNHPDLDAIHRFTGFRGNLNEDRTPDWCPFLIKPNEQ
jgi:hypothetical protein